MLKKIKYGMVGGGDGSFIGAVHRSAAAVDGELELVCGAFSSNPGRSIEAAERLGIKAQRAYPDFETMMRSESQLASGERMEFVSVVTPNHLHFDVADCALRAGFHVLSDKPATISLEQCIKLQAQLRRSGRLYGLTHPYTAYPMIAEAKERIAAGELGKVRKVIVEYTQGWLTDPVEHHGNAQAQWRTNPLLAGPSGCFGDIGVHAFNLTEYVTGLRVSELSAELNRIVSERQLDDDGTALLKFDNGAHGVLIASQICAGEENRLSLRIYGDRAGLEWQQMEPNSLWLRHTSKPTELVRTGTSFVSPSAAALGRVPAGHPEGYIEAFANIYRSFAAGVRLAANGNAAGSSTVAGVPGIGAALRGMAFIEAVVAASVSKNKWHSFPAVSESKFSRGSN